MPKAVSFTIDIGDIIRLVSEGLALINGITALSAADLERVKQASAKMDEAINKLEAAVEAAHQAHREGGG